MIIRAPTAPGMIDDSTKAAALNLAVAMPIVSAASSLSRMARSPEPKRDSLTTKAMITLAHASASTIRYKVSMFGAPNSTRPDTVRADSILTTTYLISSDSPNVRMTKYGPRTRRHGYPTSAAKPAAAKPASSKMIQIGNANQQIAATYAPMPTKTT